MLGVVLNRPSGPRDYSYELARLEESGARSGREYRHSEATKECQATEHETDGRGGNALGDPNQGADREVADQALTISAAAADSGLNPGSPPAPATVSAAAPTLAGIERRQESRNASVGW